MAAEKLSPPRKLALAASLVALPVVLFFSILFYFALNVPLMDDYDAGLDYLNHMTQQQGFWAKFVWCMTAQHNEYKTVFGNAVVWMQTAIFGHIDFRLTCFLGNLFIPFIGVLLWKMFLPEQKDLTRRIVLFLPATLILFQLNYVETLNWAMPALQYLPAVAFAFAAIYLLVEDAAVSYYLALATMALSISASTNGFFVVPVGILIMVNRRRYARTCGWLAVTAMCLGVYLFRYTVLPSMHPERQSFFVGLIEKAIFLLGMMGSAAFIPKAASVGLGLVILLYLGYVARRGYWRKNPTVSYCVLFVLFTVVAVTALRTQNGVWGGLVSRYRIYCDLLIIFGWFSFVEEFLLKQPGSLRNNRQLQAVLIASASFCLLMDAGGIYSLHKRNRGLIRGISLYENAQPGQPSGPVLPTPGQPREYDAFDAHARAVLDHSIEIGIYRLPVY